MHCQLLHGARYAKADGVPNVERIVLMPSLARFRAVRAGGGEDLGEFCLGRGEDFARGCHEEEASAGRALVDGAHERGGGGGAAGLE